MSDVVSRKDVPFEVSKTKCYFSVPFLRKTEILGQSSTGLSAQKGLNSGDAHLQITLNSHRSPMKVV